MSAPEVPYSSHGEYEEMLESLIVEYGNMLCHQSASVWAESGLGLLLKLTKGMDSFWCTYIILLPVCLIEMSLTFWRMQRVYNDEPEDDETIHEFLRGETRKELLRRFRDPDSSGLMARNFRQVSGGGEWIPIAQWREMQLAFCMINHGRLGSGASGSVLGCDVIKLILTQVIE